ncbi:lipase chaperone [Shewanella sp. VB17]|uniref:lipase secretion chaperone n=1 Tax=Shewanella sp. VB17 TaxID=2739432 RepID=UPI001563957F|nr:lipase secretion chaperone [Shewanella sp. VB17]NRD73385.1 lipase chaperone [Shewanella sp. VB17]
MQQSFFKNDEPYNNNLVALPTENDIVIIPPENIIDIELTQLNIDLELRWQFDKIIHAYQETQQSILSLLNILAKQLELTSASHKQLLDLFYRYQDYKIALVAIKQQGPNLLNQLDIDDVLTFIELAHHTQFDYFSEIEIDAFFSNENTYDNQAIERMSILQDNTLSRAQKNSLIAHQISQMNEQDRQVYEPSLHVFNIFDSFEDKNSIINDFKPDVMERITHLRKDELTWRNRVIKFQKFQMESNNKHMSKTQIKDLITHYRNQHFSQNERKRLQVFIDNPTLFDDR